MKTFICQICKHVAFDEAPVDCPVCGMAIENFDLKEALQKPSDPQNLNPTEMTHVPLIKVNRDCTFASESNCSGIHINIGNAEHVMESEHLIKFVDLYINKKYIARTTFTYNKLQPACSFHVNDREGKLRVIAYCNVHGYWTSRINLDEA
ncbi:MAG: hypothetical protein ISR96_02830 [Nitrospira sp.]|nr:hypothetical protein [bacterium]MBL7048449.1 hypothetical protein [Nitrospira sp.]